MDPECTASGSSCQRRPSAGGNVGGRWSDAGMTLADDFRRLHAEGVLVLPNAWDAASARLVERAGAAAVATTSGAVAWSLGAARRRPAAAGAARRRGRADRGRGRAAGHRRRRVRRAGRGRDGAGGAGGRRGRDQPRGPRRRGRAAPGPGRGGPGGRRPETCSSTPASTSTCSASATRTTGWPRRSPAPGSTRRPARTGSSCPGVTRPADLLRTLVGGDPAAAQRAGRPGCARRCDELAAVGVRRVSVGTGLAQAAYAAADRAARELLATGTYGALAGGLDYGDLQKLLGLAASARHRRPAPPWAPWLNALIRCRRRRGRSPWSTGSRRRPRPASPAAPRCRRARTAAGRGRPRRTGSRRRSSRPAARRRPRPGRPAAGPGSRAPTRAR